MTTDRGSRKGIALITVILISALVLAAILGISAKVMSENGMVVAASIAQRAQTAAETGLSQVLFNVRNTDFIAQTTVPVGYIAAPCLTVANMNTLAGASVGFVFSGAETVVPGSTRPYVTYQVKIRKQSGDIWSPGTSASADRHQLTLDVFSLGTVYSDSTRTAVLARKVIASTYNVVVNGAQSTTPQTLKLGILVGGDLNFSGSASVTGDVFANGSITNKGGGNMNRVSGTAYANGSIAHGVSVTAKTGVNTIDIAKQFATLTSDLAWAFKQGAAPYDGSVSGYPDTRGAAVQSVIKAYLPGTSASAGDSLQNIHAFYNDLLNGTGQFASLKTSNPAALSSLQAGEKNIAYYYNGSLSFTGSTIASFGDSSFLSFGGILIINGNLAVTSSGTIGNPSLLDLTLVVNGSTAIKAGGAATFNGLLYIRKDLSADEADKGKTAGSLTINGGLVTEGNMDVKGNSSIVYHDVGLNTITIPVTQGTNGVTSADMGTSSWKETSYDVFSALGS